MDIRHQTEHDASVAATQAADCERRAILERLGKMAALTGPTMITLLMSNRALAASPEPPPVDP